MSRKEYLKEEKKLKKIALSFSIVLILTIITFIAIFSLYNKKLKENAENSILRLGSINAVVPNSNVTEITNPVSTSSDKGINEVKTEKKSESKMSSKKETIKENNNTESSNTVLEQNTVTEQGVVENEELEFMAPVIGEITKDFANDTLLYSKTLDEWTTHNGIDIKAEKTSIVVASETGVIESIKNDPRYGLTVTIAHREGFKTIYSNLLSTEFITEGETVERGQTIATVGESSSFEIADETHLHFEMMKDGQYANPTIYLK